MGIIFFPINNKNYVYEYKHKIDMVKNVPSPRIVLIGGSGLAYGVKSSIIEDSLKIKVINYGLHAGIGLKYMLDDINKYLVPGDMVIIIPEYQHFFGNFEGVGDALNSVLLVTKFDNIQALNWGQWSNVVGNIGSYLKNQILIEINNKSNRYFEFNRFGDEVLHYEKKRLDKVPLLPLKELDDKSIKYTAKIIKEWIEKGVIVYLFPPATIKSNYEINKDKIKDLKEKLQDAGVPFNLGTETFVMEDTMAFDTSYHLTESGADLFTDMLIEKLSN